MRRLPRLLLLGLVLVLLAPAAALASGQDVIRDCEENGELTKTYTVGEYRAALKSLPDDLKEYSNCEALIDSALQRAIAAKRKAKEAGGGAPAGSGGAGGGSGGSGPSAGSSSPSDQVAEATGVGEAFQPPSAEEDQAVDKARFNRDAVALPGGHPVRPGTASALVSGLEDLPAPLHAVLIGLAVLALAGLLLLLRRAAAGGPAAFTGLRRRLGRRPAA